MKHSTYNHKIDCVNKITQLAFVLAFLFTMVLPYSGYSQTAENVVIFVKCVEDNGDGTFTANFDYSNNWSEIVTLDRKSQSQLIYEGSKGKDFSLETFYPDNVARPVDEVLPQKIFDNKERVRWQMTLNNGDAQTVSASFASPRCLAIENISTYYAPPSGGKIYNSLIGPELTYLHDFYDLDPLTFDAESDDIFQINATNVFIEISVVDGQYDALLTKLRRSSYGLTGEIGNDGSTNTITGWYPIENLLLLNKLATQINFVRPVYPAIENTIIGQGDLAIRADYVRNGLGVLGEGVKVGVISNSYNTKGGANNDIFNGDLPGVFVDPIDGTTQPNPNNGTPVDIVLDYETNNPLSDEGRAMLQIIHDIAPKADLAFRTGYHSAGDFATGIKELQTAGCDVIVDDITYVTETFFYDGVVAKAVDEVASDPLNPVAYFSAAGNFGHTSYEEKFLQNPALTNPVKINGQAHDFGGVDGLYQKITLNTKEDKVLHYTLVLQWEQTENVTTTDLDVYLSDGVEVEDVNRSFLGYNRDNLGGDPIEILPFTVSGKDVPASIVIAKTAGPDVRFKYIVFRGHDTYKMDNFLDGASTIVGQANAAGAIAVGAVLYTNTPAYLGTPSIASFSSIGGTPVDGDVSRYSA